MNRIKSILLVFTIATVFLSAGGTTVSAIGLNAKQDRVPTATTESAAESATSPTQPTSPPISADELRGEANGEVLDQYNSDMTFQYAYLFKTVKCWLAGEANDIMSYFNPSGIANTLYSVFLPLGMVMFLFSWLFSIYKKTVTLELYEMKGFLSSFTSMLAGMLLIAVSGGLCRVIDSIASSVTRNILAASTDKVDEISARLGSTIGSWDSYKSNIPFVGFFKQLIDYLLANWWSGIFQFGMAIAIFIICITLCIRTLKLAIYRGTAPLFFGFYGGDDTKVYLRNFLVQYGTLSFQIVMIAILLSAYEVSLASYLAAGLTSPGIGVPVVMGVGGLITVVFCIMICRSDKLFEKVFRN